MMFVFNVSSLSVFIYIVRYRNNAEPTFKKNENKRYLFIYFSFFEKEKAESIEQSVICLFYQKKEY